MNDDWDGADWAEHFSGPDDDQIERSREQDHYDARDYDESPIEESSSYWAHASNRHDGATRYHRFEDAWRRFNQLKAAARPQFQIEVDGRSWVISQITEPKEEPLSEMDPENDSKFFLGTALWHSLARHQREFALELLERPLEVNLIGETGSTLLMVAAERGYADICEKLLKLGATFFTELEMPCDPRKSGSNERANTVMQCALRSQDWPTIEVISKVYISAEWAFMMKNMEPSDVPQWGYPRLVEAARNGMSALCVEMIEHGVATSDKFDICDESPIAAAFSSDQISTCFVLAAMGADTFPLRRVDGYTDELDAVLTSVSKYCSRTEVGPNAKEAASEVEAPIRPIPAVEPVEEVKKNTLMERRAFVDARVSEGMTRAQAAKAFEDSRTTPHVVAPEAPTRTLSVAEPVEDVSNSLMRDRIDFVNARVSEGMSRSQAWKAYDVFRATPRPTISDRVAWMDRPSTVL